MLGFAIRHVAPIALSAADRDTLHELLAQVVESARVADVVRKVERYLELLSDWNQRGNLLSRNDLSRVVERHVRESLACVPLLDELGARDVIDVGSGGGFPGVLIQVARPSWRVVLLESRRMKSLFLQQVVRSLPLENARVVNARVESFGTRVPESMSALDDDHDDHESSAQGRAVLPGAELRPGTFDVVTARAVAAIDQITEWTAPLLHPGGYLVTFKGSKLEDELRAWKPASGTWESPRIVASPIPHLRFVVLRRM